MSKTALLTLSLLAFGCQANENWFETSAQWLKSALPKSHQFSFDKTSYKAAACKQKHYQIDYRNQISTDFSISTRLIYNKNRYYLGGQNQKVETASLSFVPEYQVSQHISIGAGIELAKAPEFKSADIRFELPKSRTLLLVANLESDQQTGQWQVTLSRKHWQANDNHLDWFVHNQVDNKLSVGYQWSF